MTLKFRILAGSALAGLLVTGNASAETLEDAVASAVLSNPQLESQRVESDIARKLKRKRKRKREISTK